MAEEIIIVLNISILSYICGDDVHDFEAYKPIRKKIHRSISLERWHNRMESDHVNKIIPYLLLPYRS